MNFLAHCVLGVLADDTGADGLIAGAIVGDLWKGAVPGRWPATIQSGVRLHRRIDAISNRHPAIRVSCDRFPAALRRLAPILVDIHADLSLAHRWADHVPVQRDPFTRRCNTVIGDWRTWELDLAEPAERFLDYMVSNDLLNAYAGWEGVEVCIRGMARRLRRPDLVDAAVDACRSLSGLLTDDFDAYFPDLLSEARQFMASELNDKIREQ